MSQQPQGPVVIVQQSQQQTQNGCCAGAGCGWALLIGILLVGFGALLDVLTGVYGTAWAIIGWVGTVVMVLLVIGGTVAWADQRFGWGLMDSPTGTPDTPQAHTRTPEEVLQDDAENYGTAPETFPGFDTRRHQADAAHSHPAGQQPLSDSPADGGETTEEDQVEHAVVLKDPGGKKIAVIKRIRENVDIGLVEAKNLVDTAPNIVAEGLSKREAENLKASLEAVGATVELW